MISYPLFCRNLGKVSCGEIFQIIKLIIYFLQNKRGVKSRWVPLHFEFKLNFCLLGTLSLHELTKLRFDLGCGKSREKLEFLFAPKLAA